MKPSEMVLLGAGWSEGDLYYEAYSLKGGFFELRWRDTLSPDSPVKDMWFKNRPDIMTVYNAVVVAEDTTPAVQRMRREKIEDEKFIDEIDPWTLIDDPYAALDCKEVARGDPGIQDSGSIIACPKCKATDVTVTSRWTTYFCMECDHRWTCRGVFGGHTTGCKHPPLGVLQQKACRQKLVPKRRRIESLVDEVKVRKVASENATHEHRAATKCIKDLETELIPLLEGVGQSDPVDFEASFDGRSFRSPTTEPDVVNRKYSVHLLRNNGSAGGFRISITALTDGKTFYKGVNGLHRLVVLEYLLSFNKRDIGRTTRKKAEVSEVPTMPW